MSSDTNIATFVFASAMTAIFAALFLRKSRKGLFICLGAMLVFKGLGGLLAGKFWQQYNAAPPLEGLAAFLGSITFVAAGVLIVFLSLRKRSGDSARNAEPDAPPNSRPPSQLPGSPKVQTPDSLRTPPSGGCG